MLGCEFETHAWAAFVCRPGIISRDMWHTVLGCRGVVPDQQAPADIPKAAHDPTPRTSAGRSHGGHLPREAEGLAVAGAGPMQRREVERATPNG